MALDGKIVSQFQIKVSAQKFYKILKDLCFHIPTISPKVINQVEIHGGDWDNHGHGSVKIWNYVVGKCISKNLTLIYIF